VTQLTGALSKTFEEHSGRVVKLLGDGLGCEREAEGAPVLLFSVTA
jgi:hypothetical protein